MVSGGIAIFILPWFSVTVPVGKTIQARGTLPLAIYSYGTIVVDLRTVEANVRQAPSTSLIRRSRRYRVRAEMPVVSSTLTI